VKRKAPPKSRSSVFRAPAVLSLTFIFLLAACDIPSGKSYARRSFSSEEPVYQPLEPTGIKDGICFYRLYGFGFSFGGPLRSTRSSGCDFTVVSFKDGDENTFSCYFGYFPHYPWPLAMYDYEIDTDVIKSDWFRRGNHSAAVEVSLENGTDEKGNALYRKDSMWFETIELDDKMLWISRPLNGRKGAVDIGIAFKADDTPERLHLMGKTDASGADDPLIGIARSMTYFGRRFEAEE
jgi:hypothetical protein